jgi:hypothetical protein
LSLATASMIATRRANALVAARAHFRQCAAFAAEAVIGVPGEQARPLRKRAQRSRVDQTLHIDRAIVDRLDRLRQRFGFRGDRNGDDRTVWGKAQQDGIAGFGAERNRFGRGEITLRTAFSVEFKQDAAIPHQQQPRSRIGERFLDGIVGPVLRLPVDNIAGETDELARLGLRRVEKAEWHGGLWQQVWKRSL